MRLLSRRPALAACIAAATALALAACATASPPPGPTAEAAPALRSATDDGDASTYGLYLAGETALNLGAGDEAAAYLARASRSDPDDTALRDRAFTANLLAGRVDEAVPFATPAVANGDGLASMGALATGVSEMARGHARAARTALAAASTGPHAGGAQALLPWAELLAGATPVLPEGAAKPGDLLAERGQALNRARLLERLGRRGEAEAAYRSAFERGGAVLAWGGFLERRDRRPEALKIYAAALAKAPSDPALLQALSRVAANGAAPPQPTPLQAAAEALVAPAEGFAAHRQPEVGVIYLRLALRLDPALASAWLAVGDALQSGGDAPDAEWAWRQVRADQPEHAGAAGRLAVALNARGDKAGALQLAGEAARAAPADPAIQEVYAELLRDAGRYDEAVASADRLVRGLAPDAKNSDSARLVFLRGTLLERAGRWPEAEADLRRAVALQPDNAEMLNYLGFAWADRGEHLTEALALLEKAAAVQPEDGAIADSVGWARYRLGDTRGAVRDLERAVGLAPADPDVNDHLGDAYARAGRRTEAAYQWRRVLSLDPDAKLRAAVERKLRTATGPATST